MAIILGTGAFRYEVVDDWAKLPPGQEFNADVAGGGGRRAGPRVRVQPRRASDGRVRP